MTLRSLAARSAAAASRPSCGALRHTGSGGHPKFARVPSKAAFWSSAVAPARKSDVFRAHLPGKGGVEVDPKKTAVLFIEFQNEFCTEGGKLHDGVKDNMKATGMLDNASRLAKHMRAAGVHVFHAPISFAADQSDNPNPNLGILAGCREGNLFTENTWNSAICDAMKPEAGDVLVKGKKGLSAFPGTDLEEQLLAKGIETIALGGFMANCCVESTMREAYDKGFNVITLTDCVGTTSEEGYKAATEITYTFFSSPMTADEFRALVKA